MQSPRVQFGFRQSVINKPVLLSSDLDDTLLHWQGDHAAGGHDRQALQQTTQRLRYYSDRLAVHVNTGRGLTSMQHAAPYLKGVPIDYLSLNNGQELYVNRQRQRSDQWIANLTAADQEPVWRAWIAKQTGWQAPQVQTIMRSVIETAGYQVDDSFRFENDQFKHYVTFQRQLPNREIALVNWFPDQPVFTISGLRYHSQGGAYRVYDAPVAEEGERLMAAIRHALAQQKIQITPIPLVASYEGAPFRMGVLTPAGINKASVIDALAQWYLPRLKAVLTAGDHPYNDSDMLLRDQYRGKKRLRLLRRSIPNYPILSGAHPAMVNPFAQHPRGVQVPAGYLGQGLDAHFKNLTQGKRGHLLSWF